MLPACRVRRRVFMRLPFFRRACQSLLFRFCVGKPHVFRGIIKFPRDSDAGGAPTVVRQTAEIATDGDELGHAVADCSAQ